jgi:hypothetical protein
MAKVDRQAAAARFIFRGTVLGDAKSRTAPAEVRVDEILEGPSVMAGYEGRNLRVVPPEGEALASDETAIFHCGGYEFGEQLTAHAVRVERGGGLLVAGRQLGRGARAAAADRRMRERVEKAHVVVAGVVVSVRLPEQALLAATRAATPSPQETGRITEHDPHWREAVVRVTQVHKGTHRGREVVVRYPASDDVRWFRAPKLQAGQKGVFALQKIDAAEPATTARAMARAATAPDHYSALDAADVQPLERQEEIAQLVASAAPPTQVAAGRGAKRPAAVTPAARATRAAAAAPAAAARGGRRAAPSRRTAGPRRGGKRRSRPEVR